MMSPAPTSKVMGSLGSSCQNESGRVECWLQDVIIALLPMQS